MPEKTPFRKAIEGLEREFENSQTHPLVARRIREVLAAHLPILVATRKETEAVIREAVERAVPGGVGYEAPIAGIRQTKPEAKP